ncbi:hypothetical protein MKW94_029321 [Papaver nudicaule]|uniref:Uncharacterized protein n=2 Tax=Papaver nudicaule TaxID=74823 RepID=A0AA42B3W2_PAPNU|nr:hypothetical protein [Papaver nudicaule]
MGRAPCCEKVGLKRGRWTAEEDAILTNYIQAYGEGSWRSLPKNAGLLRCGKSCRLRWINYLRADLKRGNISTQEEDMIIKLHSTLGNKWSVIAGHLPGRTDNEIKNYWNSHLSRRIHTFRRPLHYSKDTPTLLTVDTPKLKSTNGGKTNKGGKKGRANMKRNKIPSSNNKPTTMVERKTTDGHDHRKSGCEDEVMITATPISPQEKNTQMMDVLRQVEEERQRRDMDSCDQRDQAKEAIVISGPFHDEVVGILGHSEHERKRDSILMLCTSEEEMESGLLNSPYVEQVLLGSGILCSHEELIMGNENLGPSSDIDDHNGPMSVHAFSDGAGNGVMGGLSVTDDQNHDLVQNELIIDPMEYSSSSSTSHDQPEIVCDDHIFASSNNTNADMQHGGKELCPSSSMNSTTTSSSFTTINTDTIEDGEWVYNWDFDMGNVTVDEDLKATSAVWDIEREETLSWLWENDDIGDAAATIPESEKQQALADWFLSLTH